jgi:hypothetical protein
MRNLIILLQIEKQLLIPHSNAHHVTYWLNRVHSDGNTNKSDEWRSLFPGYITSYPAQAFCSNAEVRSQVVVFDMLFNVWVGFYKPDVLFLGR